MRRKILVGNWKMNKTLAETKEFVEAVDSKIHHDADFGIAVPYLDLLVARKAENLIVAAENCHFKDSGAYTGEVSVPMLEEIGIKWCIIGHSERRSMFGDTDETVNLKAKRLFEAGITPIVCVGETEAEFDAGKTEEVLNTQIHGSLKELNPEDVKKMVVAYEPIWAIGTGKSADSTIAENCCKYVRSVIEEMYGKEVADEVRIQYGGSVKPENVAEYMAQEDIDGALVGGASLKVDSFLEMVDKVH